MDAAKFAAHLVFCALALPLAAQEGSAHASKSPPAGPPWVTDFAAARAAALAAHRPIFVYSTKTYCPHCEVMEKGLLSDKELAKDYGDVVWMYLYQDFSHSDADRAAERVAIRFGISSWPQHFLVDPVSLAKVADTGRSLPTFRAAVKLGRGRLVTGEPDPSVADLAAADALAERLEEKEDVALAKQNLRHEDRVVAFRALQILTAKAPKEVVEESDFLLGTPNDQIRGLVCDLLAEQGDVTARDRLHAIAQDPRPSENPNVMRMRAVKALARCGDATSLPIVGPFASSGEYRNGLTMTAIRTVVALAAQGEKVRAAAIGILAAAYPALPTGTDAASEQRMCESLARNVHGELVKLTGRSAAFPANYDDASRQKLMRSW